MSNVGAFALGQKKLKVLSIHYPHIVGGVHTWNQRNAELYRDHAELGIDWKAVLTGSSEDFDECMASVPEDLREFFISVPITTNNGLWLHRWGALKSALRAHPEWADTDAILPNDQVAGWQLIEAMQSHFRRRPAVVGALHCDQDYHYDFTGAGGQPVEAVFAVSQHIVREFSRRFPALPAATYISYGIPVPSLGPKPADGPLQLAFVGRLLRSHKRAMDLIPLVANLSEAKVDFHLHVLGNGELSEQLGRELPAPGPGGITIHGSLPAFEIPQFFSNKHVFISTSEFEGTSISMLESMGCALVPVVTDIASGVRDVIGHGQNGWIVPIGDMNAMAGVVIELSKDRSKTIVAGRAARERIMENYSPYEMARRLAAVIHDAVAKPRPPFRLNANVIRVGKLDSRWVPPALTLALRRISKA